MNVNLLTLAGKDSIFNNAGLQKLNFFFLCEKKIESSFYEERVVEASLEASTHSLSWCLSLFYRDTLSLSRKAYIEGMWVCNSVSVRMRVHSLSKWYVTRASFDFLFSFPFINFLPHRLLQLREWKITSRGGKWTDKHKHVTLKMGTAQPKLVNSPSTLY